MNDKKTVLYIGNFSFPLGNAAGKRVYANGKLLKELGYKVIFIGTDSNINNTNLIETKKEFDGFKYYNFQYPRNNKSWIRYKKSFNKLIKLLQTDPEFCDIRFIIYYGSPSISLFIKKLIQYCKENDIKIITDCVDWLSFRTGNIIFNIVKSLDNTYQKAYINKKADGVIAISNYLANYYKRFNLPTVIIPPLTPAKYIQNQTNRDRKNIIVYAGVPFRKNEVVGNVSTLKDRIDKVIILFYYAKLNQYHFEFHIFGFTKEEYLKVLPSQKKYIEGLDESIIFHGYAKNEEVVSFIAKSDFTILIRDINRDTTAGFPTKISESISCGTPVITTRTSDLSDYIFEGENGFYLDNTLESDLKKLKEVLSLSFESRKQMKEYCIKHNSFEYNNFLEAMEEFMNSLI